MTQGPDFEVEVVDVEPAALFPSVSSFAPLEERQGVFAHSFKCQNCGLEFALFSWWPDRHTVMNTACPECRRITSKVHWVSVLADDPQQCFGGGPEIYEHSPVGPNPMLMRDSSILTGNPLARIRR